MSDGPGHWCTCTMMHTCTPIVHLESSQEPAAWQHLFSLLPGVLCWGCTQLNDSQVSTSSAGSVAELEQSLSSAP
jgi:hypothetical protein